MHILVINCGSSSIKYQLINHFSEQCVLKKTIETTLTTNVSEAIGQILNDCATYKIDAVGHRVVHGGDSRHAQLIDEKVIKQIEHNIRLAPLHNPHNLAGIKAVRALLPDMPQVAVFDTAFHASLPRRASTYAINQEIAQKYGIRRYGFHGTSHSYVSEMAADFLGQPMNNLRMISLHLGNGASACAVEFGSSTETSMGMTPLEGLVMGTRSGDIDPGIIFTLAQDAKMDLPDINHLLNNESGLKGLSGISNDLRQLEQEAALGNDNARLAITVFAHQVRKYIGSYAASMGGVDVIIMTGGIGENSASMRRRIMQRLEFLGLALDEDLNLDAQVTYENPVIAVHQANSRIKVLVIKTNEELKIARQTISIVQQKHHISHPGHIPISVSARHVHLCADTFAQLFGADAQPTHYKDLLQPGQYACQETVNLIGPKGRINKVRVLGPLRKADQVEISRTDEFQLGVDAPVRDSGHTVGSAPITLEGPLGTVHIKEGLICARRHIHMHPDDAVRFGVKDGDEVEVAITGGIRDLTFGGVVIRVSPSYQLEMHIDTDEANAAELSPQTDATLVYHTVDKASAQLRLNASSIK